MTIVSLMIVAGICVVDSIGHKVATTKYIFVVYQYRLFETDDYI